MSKIDFRKEESETRLIECFIVLLKAACTNDVLDSINHD